MNELLTDLELTPQVIMSRLERQAELITAKRNFKEGMAAIQLQAEMDGAGSGKNAEERKRNLQVALNNHQDYRDHADALREISEKLDEVSAEISGLESLIKAQIARANLMAAMLNNGIKSENISELI